MRNKEQREITGRLADHSMSLKELGVEQPPKNEEELLKWSDRVTEKMREKLHKMYPNVENIRFSWEDRGNRFGGESYVFDVFIEQEG